jgi:hypothetical protein
MVSSPMYHFGLLENLLPGLPEWVAVTVTIPMAGLGAPVGGKLKPRLSMTGTELWQSDACPRSALASAPQR